MTELHLLLLFAFVIVLIISCCLELVRGGTVCVPLDMLSKTSIRDIFVQAV